MVASFEADHRRTYGHAADNEPVDVVNLRVTAHVGTNGETRQTTVRQRSGVAPDRHERQAYFGEAHGLLTTPVIARSGLTAEPIGGPVIIEEYDATCVVPPGFSASIDEWGNIVVES
jgi:N-methylhydantoinase A